jgi:hypothetical protein
MGWFKNPFGSVSSYPDMLQKIAEWTFFITLLTVLLLAWQIPALNHQLEALNQQVGLKDLPFTLAPVSLGAVLIAVGIAWVTRSIRWHNRLADFFHIRDRFDVRHILLPLAASCGVTLSSGRLSRVVSQRPELMEQAFYHYTRTTPPIVSAHSVGQALDRWGNFWILLEASSIALPGAIVLTVAGRLEWAVGLLMLILAAIYVMHLIRLDCERHAQTQVAMIVDDPTTGARLNQIFSAL